MSTVNSQVRIYSGSREVVLKVLVSEFPNKTAPELFDTIESQLKELFRCHFPDQRPTDEIVQGFIHQKLNGSTLDEYGCWVYYPWLNKLVHILEELDFAKVRTNRNLYKLTQDEQDTLLTKRIGIIGLSVGQAIALTLAMERGFGELRLADFDTLDLSNLNRIRASVHEIGVNKATLCARQIAEIDPYLKVTVFEEGLTEDNWESFFCATGNLDLLLEECDGLDMKIFARAKAKALGIPVVMETSDRGMLDIERFDLEPERPLIHGLVGDLNPAMLKGLSQEDKIQYLLPMVGVETISDRMKASLLEVQKSILSWPQLASDVVKGGGIAAEMSRMILLKQSAISGRFYVDLKEILNEGDPNKGELSSGDVPAALTKTKMIELISALLPFESNAQMRELKNEELSSLINAAITAPSGGNVQPWKFCYAWKRLFVFHDEHESYALLDFHNLGSYLAIGAAIENIEITAKNLGIAIKTQHFPNPKERHLVAMIEFPDVAVEPSAEPLYESIFQRITNRNYSKENEISEQALATLKSSFGNSKDFSLSYFKEKHELEVLGDVFSEAEMLAIMNERGHSDMIQKEIRWTPEEAERTGTGIDLQLLNLTAAQKLGMRVARDYKTIKLLKQFGGGSALKSVTKESIKHSAGVLILSMPTYQEDNFINAGKAMQRLWLEATRLKIGIQPIAQFVFLWTRMTYGDGLDIAEVSKLRTLETKLHAVSPDFKNRHPYFVFRLTIASAPEIKAYRKKIDEILFKY